MAELALKRLRKTKPLGLCLFIPWDCFVNNFSRIAKANLGGIDDPGPVLRGNHQAINQRVERLPKVEVKERLRSGELYDFAVLVEAVESARAQFTESLLERIIRKCRIDGSFCFLFLFWLGLGRHRWLYGKQCVETCALAQRNDGCGNLIHRVAPDHSTANNAMCRAATREEQPQIVVYLGRRGH